MAPEILGRRVIGTTRASVIMEGAIDAPPAPSIIQFPNLGFKGLKDSYDTGFTLGT